MRYSISIVMIIFIITISFGQNKKSKGDDYFFEYSYKNAIIAYEDDITKGIPLSTVQKRNLADAYFQIKNYNKASELYLQYFANDSIIDNFRLNKLFQTLSKTANREQIKTLLATKGNTLGKELIENADFNESILSSNDNLSQLDFKVFNLESNSIEADFAPTFFNTNLLFTSGRNIKKKNTGQEYLDIFKGIIKTTGQIDSTGVLQLINSSDYHKATPYYSEELESIFYVLSNTFDGELEFDDSGKNALAIGVQKIDGDFRFLWRDLSTSFYYPFYDAETDRLYFAANFKEGYGGTDIYYVNTNRGNIMSAPINLGSRVNSPGNEIAPFVFENSLYFASDVFYGLGGMDIYKTNITSNDTYSIPVNLGRAINTENDDFGFIMRDQGEGLLGYFSSNRDGGKGSDDIYGFMVDEKPGLKTLVLQGKIVTGKYNSPLEGAEVSLKLANGELLKKVVTTDNGEYRIEVPWQEEVVLEASKKKHSVFSQKYLSTAIEELQNMDTNISLVAYDDIVEEKEGQTVIKLRKFFFQRSKTTITPEIAVELDKAAEVIKLFPQIQLRIETHTDSRGGGATNFRLTQLRSDAIKKYLISKNVPAANILYSVGYGEDKILNNCKNGVYCLDILHKKNQRSLLVVLNDNVLFD